MLSTPLCSAKDLAEHCGVGGLAVVHQAVHLKAVLIYPHGCSVQHPLSPYSPLTLHWGASAESLKSCFQRRQKESCIWLLQLIFFVFFKPQLEVDMLPERWEAFLCNPFYVFRCQGRNTLSTTRYSTADSECYFLSGNTEAIALVS